MERWWRVAAQFEEVQEWPFFAAALPMVAGPILSLPGAAFMAVKHREARHPTSIIANVSPSLFFLWLLWDIYS